MASSLTDNCIYKSVILAPGEEFNLPPGALLISASDTTAITSTCPIPALEQPACYFFALGTLDGDGDGRAEYWEDSQSKIYGFKYGNTIVSGPDIYGTPYYDMTAVYNMIAATLPITLVGTFANNGPSSNDSAQSGLVFKMIPSLASQLSLLIVAYANMAGSPAYYTSPARSHDEGIAQGIMNFPACS
jgi:hypothetical protein